MKISIFKAINFIIIFIFNGNIVDNITMPFDIDYWDTITHGAKYFGKYSGKVQLLWNFLKYSKYKYIASSVRRT